MSAAPLPQFADAGGVPPAPGPRRRERRRLSRRLSDTVASYLPLLLMAALAMFTWWLVKNTPLLEAAPPPQALRHEADYTMTDFQVQRFDRQGALRAEIQGSAMRHFPDTDTLEIDNPHIRAFGTDGRVTVATAEHALASQDGAELELTGGAHVTREATPKEPAIEFRSEYLHAYRYAERLQTNQPVVVVQGRSEVHANSLDYDNLNRVLELRGRVRERLSPP